MNSYSEGMFTADHPCDYSLNLEEEALLNGYLAENLNQNQLQESSESQFTQETTSKMLSRSASASTAAQLLREASLLRKQHSNCMMLTSTSSSTKNFNSPAKSMTITRKSASNINKLKLVPRCGKQSLREMIEKKARR